MNLLEYTKRLSEKIKFYDSMAQTTFWGTHTANPFAKPLNITIIWVEDDFEK